MGRKHTDDEVLEIVDQMRDLLYKRWNYDQIRKEYSKNGKPMPASTLHWYLKRMKEEDEKSLSKNNIDKVPTEVSHLVKMIDGVILWCEKNINDEEQPLRDRLEVQKLKTQMQAAKIKILIEGPSVAQQVMKLTMLIPKEDREELNLPWEK